MIDKSSPRWRPLILLALLNAPFLGPLSPLAATAKTSQEAALVAETNAQGDTALHLAATHGMLHWLQWLLESGADVTLRNQAGLTPFLAAAQAGHCSVMQALHQHNARVLDDTRPNGQGPLHLAIQNQQLQSLACLMQLKANPLQSDKNGESALILAVRRADKKSLEAFENHGFRVKQWLLRPRQDGRNWLQYFASRPGHSGSLKLLLDYGLDPLRAQGGPSALQEALSHKLLDHVALLLSDKGNIRSSTEARNVWRYVSPLLTGEKLSSSAQRDVLNDLLQDLLRFENFIESNALMHQRIQEQDFVALQFLSRFSADLEHQNAEGDSLLLHALRQDGPQQRAMVEFLLASGANPQAQDSEGNSALHLAVLNHRKVLVKMLLSHVDSLPRNQQGKTALDLAREQNDSEIMSLLRPLYIKNLMRGQN